MSAWVHVLCVVFFVVVYSVGLETGSSLGPTFFFSLFLLFSLALLYILPVGEKCCDFSL